MFEKDNLLRHPGFFEKQIYHEQGRLAGIQFVSFISKT